LPTGVRFDMVHRVCEPTGHCAVRSGDTQDEL
jgi:hypothetical protein